MKTIAIILGLLLSLSSVSLKAADTGYYSFEPDITTNYIKAGKKLGYIRLTMEVMVADSRDLKYVSLHEPLLRAAVIEILGKQNEKQIKSLENRPVIRKACFDKINELLNQEVGRPIAAQLLFTKYLHE
ncbi:flagellar basal body-associated FliL family protein [Paraferrimonas sp. SM1919]|uniref:flagellar basal body-associated FliL family protein n=1 Tax=Paraferrimonas sp. SM1919 TaxID=2662263 RepID=UPI0013D82BED|nr:flagellar basal body-associated FliL family protein [Paraferrimonas sp. SM1919]